MKIIFCMLLVLLQSTACNSTNQVPLMQKSADLQESKHSLDSRIAPPNPSKYKDIRDGKDWQNPYLVILPEGVEVTTRSPTVERRIVTCGELTEFLVSLPITSWPYGRVIAVSETGIRSSNGKDDQRITENKMKTEKILASLDVKVDWWPSA